MATRHRRRTSAAGDCVVLDGQFIWTIVNAFRYSDQLDVPVAPARDNGVDATQRPCPAQALPPAKNKINAIDAHTLAPVWGPVVLGPTIPNRQSGLPRSPGWSNWRISMAGGQRPLSQSDSTRGRGSGRFMAGGRAGRPCRSCSFSQRRRPGCGDLTVGGAVAMNRFCHSE